MSPIINKIKKHENNVLVEWDNDNPEKISKFIVFIKIKIILINQHGY